VNKNKAQYFAATTIKANDEKKHRKRVYLYYQGETIRKNREEKQNP
jgi:hypothetical protein